MACVGPDQTSPKPPGFLWVVVLGVAGFAAGFFGPIIFVPEANQGPLVGIFISGPAGFVLGLLLWLVFRFLPVAARTQWRLLAAIGTVAVLATLLCVQPEPATKGYLLELEIRGQRPTAATADEVVADWKKQIAAVTWATPRAGWEPQMRATLAADQGLVLDAVIVRQRMVKVHRKPWNRGRLFATAWQTRDEPRSYYFPAGTVPAGPLGPGTRVQFFLPYDSTAPIKAPDAWPPLELVRFIGFSRLQPVPAEYQSL